MCNIWLRSDGRVERKRGYRHTDSWHELLWRQRHQADSYQGTLIATHLVITPSIDIVPQKAEYVICCYDDSYTLWLICIICDHLHIRYFLASIYMYITLSCSHVVSLCIFGPPSCVAWITNINNDPIFRSRTCIERKQCINTAVKLPLSSSPHRF